MPGRARGARPVFCDVDPATLNLAPIDCERRITSLIRAIMPVHYPGVSADLDALEKLCKKHGLILLEDATPGIGATYRGRHLGTIGDAGFL
jgi:dTDP-4-amino-4,6-dideoxygalactose transaminase